MEFLGVTPKKNHLEASWSFQELHQRLCNRKTIDIKHKKIFKVLNDVAADAGELAEDVKLPYSLVGHFLENNYYEQPSTVKENVFICDRR